jgi:iron complex outermembrane recepter protein
MQQNFASHASNRHPVAHGAGWLLVAGVFLGGTTGHAAENPAEASAEGAPVLEEIVVNAQKRVENLQSVPISVEVVQSARLAQQNLNSLKDLTRTTPSVLVDDGGRSQTLRIRGIGSGPNQSFDQSVAVFVDDIYHGRSRASVASFLDLERVEILKGPQSTFFGNNAIAGAFNIITQKPSDRFEGSVRGLYGEDQQYAAEAAAGGPLTERVSARAAVMVNGSGGWVDDVTTGKKGPFENDLTGRVTLLARPVDDLTATLKVEGSRNQSAGYFLTINNCPPPPPFPVSAYCTSAINRGLPIGVGSNANSQGPGQGMRYTSHEEVLTVNYDHWQHTFTSVSGFYKYNYNLNVDLGGAPEFLVHARLPETYRQFSQELRVASPSNQTLEYLAGAYFQSDNLGGGSDFAYGLLNASLAPTALGPYLPVGQEIDVTQQEHSYALFGALTWHLTDRLQLTGGLRSSWVNKSFDWGLFYGSTTASYGPIVPLPPNLASFKALLSLGKPGALRLERQDHAVSPSARLQYQLAPQSMAYFSYSKGFKAGGFNFAQNTADPTQYPFAPETVKAYEVGLKNELFNNRFVLNMAVFRNDFSALQVSSNYNINGGFFSLVKNAASARSQGVELESQWAVTENFRLSASVTYLDSKYLQYPNAGASQLQLFCSANPTNSSCKARFPQGITVGPLGVDISGTRTDYAPRWSSGVTAAYSHAVSDAYRLTGELNAYQVSAYQFNLLDELTMSYVRLDSRLTLESPQSRWALDVIGRNLTDVAIRGYGGFPPGAGQTGINLNAMQPRNFAVQVRFKW